MKAAQRPRRAKLSVSTLPIIQRRIPEKWSPLKCRPRKHKTLVREREKQQYCSARPRKLLQQSILFCEPVDSTWWITVRKTTQERQNCVASRWASLIIDRPQDVIGKSWLLTSDPLWIYRAFSEKFPITDSPESPSGRLCDWNWVNLCNNSPRITEGTTCLTKHRGADKSLARPGRKQATATEDFDIRISYL